MKRLQSGIIGLGFIGPAHIEALCRSGLSDAIAIADVDIGLAKAHAEKLSIEHAYQDYHDLLDNPLVEVVHICAPNYLHFEIAHAALTKGKHVVCEKPLVTKFEDAKKLVALAKEKNLVAAVSFNLRYYPLVQQARSMVQKGSLGRLLAYHGSYLQDWLLMETDYTWRLESQISGESRAFADIGSHWLDMAEYISGKRVTALCADMATFLPVRKKPLSATRTFDKADKSAQYEETAINTEDYAAILFKFEDGVRGTATISQMAAGRKNRLAFEIDGTEGSLAWNSENPNELWNGNRNVPNSIMIKDPKLMEQEVSRFASFPGGHTEGFPDTTKQLFTDIYNYIINQGHLKGEIPSFPTFADGMREVVLCDAVLKSNRMSGWVDVTI